MLEVPVTKASNVHRPSGKLPTERFDPPLQASFARRSAGIPSLAAVRTSERKSLVRPTAHSAASSMRATQPNDYTSFLALPRDVPATIAAVAVG